MKSQLKKIIFENFVPGDEGKILKLLNFCFGEWGNLEKWRCRYPRYPTFTNEDVIVAKKQGEIVGHGGIHVRDLIFKHGCRVHAALLGDAAVHREYGRKGIYSKLLELRLDTAKSRGASFAFMWVQRDSVTYKMGIKCGFIEAKQFPLYMKIQNPEKIFLTRLTDLFHRDHKIRNAFQQLGVDICFCLGTREVRLKELLNDTVEHDKSIQIILSEEALSRIVHFRRVSNLKRVTTFFYLILSRKITIKSRSMSILLKLIICGRNIVKAL